MPCGLASDVHNPAPFGRAPKEKALGKGCCNTRRLIVFLQSLCLLESVMVLSSSCVVSASSSMAPFADGYSTGAVTAFVSMTTLTSPWVATITTTKSADPSKQRGNNVVTMGAVTPTAYHHTSMCRCMTKNAAFARHQRKKEPIRVPSFPSMTTTTGLYATLSDDDISNVADTPNAKSYDGYDSRMLLDVFLSPALLSTIRLALFSFAVTMSVITWEGIHIQTVHPIRHAASTSVTTTNSLLGEQNEKGYNPIQLGFSRIVSDGIARTESTVGGLGFGSKERESLGIMDVETNLQNRIQSYNEVMLQHRRERVPMLHDYYAQLLSMTEKGDEKISSSSSSSIANFNNRITTPTITKQDIAEAVRTIQYSLVYLQDCKGLVANYEWDTLKERIQNPEYFGSNLERACYILKMSPNQFLSKDARDEIGFGWGSCAWRHCGALADAQEAIDELDHHVGMLEPYECLFCLDIIERSLRDILAVTKDYHDKSIQIPTYEPLQRMSDDVDMNGVDADYLATLEKLKVTDF